MTVCNVSVPTISGAMGVSASQGAWIISAYSVAAAIAVPLTGWLSKRIGEARLFVFSVLAFTLMSTLAAMSQNLTMLVMFRLMQGFVSGPMVPLSQTLLVRNYPPEKRGAAMGIWAMTLLLAPVCGPLLGGYISDNYHWSWIFLVNIPIGLFCAIAISILMRHRDSVIVRIPLDKIGLALMVIGVGTLQLMLEIGHNYDWFESPYITTLGVIALISLTLFIAWGALSEHTIVDLTLFRDCNFRYGVILLSVGFTIYFGTVVVFPLWLQLVMGYTAEQAGMAIAPLGISTLLLSPIIGLSISRLNLRVVASFSFAMMGAVAAWNSMMSLDSTFWDVASPRLVQGIGMACFLLPVQAIMLSNILPDHMAAASGLANFLRTLGAAVGTAISVTSWEHLAQISRAQLSEHINDYDPASTLYMERLLANGMSTEQAYAVLDRTLFSQSYMIATNQFFMYSSVLFFLLMGVVWLTNPHKD